jgi:hypothetical protein
MPITYDNIATTTLSSPTTTFSFTSIPQTYTDLRLVFVGTGDTNGTNVCVRPNNNSSSLYTRTFMYGTGTSAVSGRQNSNVFWQLSVNDGLRTTISSLRTLDIFNYAGSTFKTALSTENADFNGSGSVLYGVNLFRDTTAITSLTILTGGAQNFNSGTTATLYGIKNA